MQAIAEEVLPYFRDRMPGGKTAQPEAAAAE
jgi:hypothetical protein